MGKSLSKEEANVIHKDIGEAVSKELGVELRWLNQVLSVVRRA
jgi:hypothetical protein